MFQGGAHKQDLSALLMLLCLLHTAPTSMNIGGTTELVTNEECFQKIPSYLIGGRCVRCKQGKRRL